MKKSLDTFCETFGDFTDEEVQKDMETMTSLQMESMPQSDNVQIGEKLALTDTIFFTNGTETTLSEEINKIQNSNLILLNFGSCT